MGLPRTLIATIPGIVSESDLVALREVSNVTYVERGHIDQKTLTEMCSGFHYLMLNYDVVKVLDASFYRHPNIRELRAISFDLTGLDWAAPSAARENGVILLNTPYYSTESVAESIVCEVLNHARQRHLAYVDLAAGREPVARDAVNIRGKVAGIIGLGHIGGRVAELLHALGMKVVFWNRTPRQSRIATAVPLGELASASDVICLCLKTVHFGEQKTLHFLEEPLLRNTKRGVIIVNLASRNLVDHAALIPHLLSGHVAGYSVTGGPKSRSLGLDKIASVSLPPANAWSSPESLTLLRRIWTQNVVSAIGGQFENIYSE